MRRLLAVLALGAVVVACSEQATSPQTERRATTPGISFAATSGWSEPVYYAPPGDGTFYAPCIDDYVDEIGHMLWRIHTVTTANGYLITHHVRVLDDWHLLGDKTGIWKPLPNQLYGTYQEHGSLVNGVYEFRDNINPYIYVNEVSGTKMNFPLKVRVTINANGVVTVDRFVETCDIVGQ